MAYFSPADPLRPEDRKVRLFRRIPGNAMHDIAAIGFTEADRRLSTSLSAQIAGPSITYIYEYIYVRDGACIIC